MPISQRLSLVVTIGVLLLFEIGITFSYLSNGQLDKGIMSTFWIAITGFVGAKQLWLNRTEGFQRNATEST